MSGTSPFEGSRPAERGDLPETWRASTLGEALKQAQYGLSIRGQKSGKYPILRMNCQKDGRVVFRDLQFVDLDEREYETYRLDQGDILFNRTNSYELVGRSAILDEARPAVFASYLLRLKTNPDQLLSGFLNYYLASDRGQMDLKSFATRGVSQSNISASKLRGLRIPLPPLPEQRAIAGVLSRLQAAVDLQDRTVAALNELKAATMAKVFREGLRGERLKQTEIGEIPESWEVVRFDSIFDVQQGKAVSPKSRVGLRRRPFLRTINVLWGDVDLGELDEMDFSEGESARLDLVEGDLLICEGGGVGRTAMWKSGPVGCGFQNHIHRARRRTEEIDPRFFVQWMAHAITQRGLYISQANRTTIPNLPASRLRSFLVPNPPTREEQAQIGTSLAAIDDRLHAASRVRKTNVELFERTLSKTMSGELRVRLELANA